MYFCIYFAYTFFLGTLFFHVLISDERSKRYFMCHFLFFSTSFTPLFFLQFKHFFFFSTFKDKPPYKRYVQCTKTLWLAYVYICCILCKLSLHFFPFLIQIHSHFPTAALWTNEISHLFPKKQTIFQLKHLFLPIFSWYISFHT